jgi:hypothetical protein
VEEVRACRQAGEEIHDESRRGLVSKNPHAAALGRLGGLARMWRSVLALVAFASVR